MPDLVDQTLLGKYRIEALVGRGGMAEVYKAWDTRRQYHVAIKVMREDLAEDIEFLRRFKQEAQALAALSHNNIVRFYSFEREGRLAFIVMDYVDGTTLRGRILDAGGSPLPLDEVTSIARQVCSALHYAHEEGLIHRDVKPGNIMLQPDGRVLLSDLGIAKAADSATVTTVMPGTPAYMSPEQCRSEPLDVRTDIYSLGVVVYEMLAGRRPFVGESKEAGTGSTQERIRREQIHANPPPLRDHNPALPLQVEQVVLKALSKKQEERWPSALAFREALDRALGVTVSEVLAQRTINLPSSLTLQVQEPPTEPRKQLAQDKEAKPRLTPRGLTQQTRGMVAVIAGALVVMLLTLALVLGRRSFNIPAVAFREMQTSTQLPPHTPTLLPTPVVPTLTETPTETPSPSVTSTSTPTATRTNTPTNTATPTSTPTATPNATATVLAWIRFKELDGVWVGTTSAGTQIKMDVKDRRIWAVRYDWPSGCDDQFVFYYGLAINTQGRFSIWNLPLDNKHVVTFYGNISSRNTASGNVVEQHQPGSQCGTSSFTWSMHWDPKADPVCECNRVTPSP